MVIVSDTPLGDTTVAEPSFAYEDADMATVIVPEVRPIDGQLAVSV